jgi:predicted aconitase
MNASGQGRAIWIGAYPGFSYARGSNVGAGLTTEYPADVREILLAPTRLAGVVRDVELSVPVVEATLQESTQGGVVTLVNFTMKPLSEVTMTVRTAKPVKRAVAVQSGKELKYSATADGVTMKLPIGLTEFVKLYY